MINFSELRSGEVTTRRAKLILFPILLVYLTDFVAMIVQWWLTGYSGITSGTRDSTGFVVIEHGHTVHVTKGQYWFGHLLIAILLVGLVAWFTARAHLFHTGDLKREPPSD